MAETLNWMLLGHMRMTRDQVQRLLDLGADPNWVPPNGHSVLEHVIWRCWSGEVVDLIASRVKPREEFWIAAGVGDVEAVKRYVDERGVPTEAARRARPDFNAIGYMPMPTNPAPDDEQIVWEAFLVAAFNQRFGVLDVLLDRGFPVDYMAWGQSALHLAVGNGWLPMVEYLIGRGANVDIRGWRPHVSARELAEQMFMNSQPGPDAERILLLCGGRDPGTLRSELASQREKRVMPTMPGVEQAYDHAKRDAVSRGLTAVGPENMFIGILRQGRLSVAMLSQAGLDLDLLRAYARIGMEIAPIHPSADITANPELSAILLDARGLAERKRADGLDSAHLLYALIQRAPTPVLKVIESAGGTKEKVLATIEQFLG
jgi:hypothetical protein